MAYTQENRLIAIDTPLGEDAVLLEQFTGREGISQLFHFELELLSEDPLIVFQGIVGQRVTLKIKLADPDERRYINGFVSRFTQSGASERFTHYRAEVVPWLWFLTRKANCRIFQNKTVPDIITQIFTDLGFRDFKNALQGNFESREYCVQYRETDFHFVTRLMEEEGIFYFFEHTQDTHTLVLANSSTVHQPCPGQMTALYEPAEGELEEEDAITKWEMRQEIRPGKYALTDYNFETPSTSLAVNIPSQVHLGDNSKYEVYDYPGKYPKRSQGETLVKVRMEEEETPGTVVIGEGRCRAFTSGYRFDLVEHYRQDMNTSYVLTEVKHSASVGDGYTTGAGKGEGYTGEFTCIPFSSVFRPPRVTPKPIVQGPQTAVVVGKAGEEMWVDKYGRVKVQFHWDREGKWDENSSCWVRVAQNWAGKRWGAMFIPRIGQEVIVDFLEGDPDRPIITGRVYNAEEMPPYELPKEQTKSTIKSNSSKGGGGFNEVRFDDAKGKEQIFIHAQRDMDVRIENDQREWIGKDQHLIVKGTRNEDVTQDFYLKSGMKIVIEAGAELTIKSAGGFIKIDPSGITIQGTLVRINSGGAPGVIPGPPDEADNAQPGAVDVVPKRDPRIRS
jgi:type VI secretion system secreted protein VgrG